MASNSQFLAIPPKFGWILVDLITLENFRTVW
jgi:hypothetical protein